jgi:uracil-DNA glycosylase
VENHLNQKLQAELNRFNVNGESMRYTPEGNIYFTSPYKKEIHIGSIVVENDVVIYIKNEDESQIIRNTNSWSINAIVLNVVDEVKYITNQASYYISKKKAYEFGKIYSKNTFGLDSKLVVPLAYWMKIYSSKEKQLSVKLFGESWGLPLYPLISDPIFKNISAEVKRDRSITGVNPSPDNVFRAFQLTSLEDIVLILVGDEPDSTQASDGLAYSGFPILEDVYNMVEEQLYGGFMLDKDTNLEKWANQGILLLNRKLTTPFGFPDGHKDIGWDYFTEYVIINALKRNPDIALFTWEEHIKQFVDSILIQNNISATHFYLNDNKHVFSHLNQHINSINNKQIDW